MPPAQRGCARTQTGTGPAASPDGWPPPRQGIPNPARFSPSTSSLCQLASAPAWPALPRWAPGEAPLLPCFGVAQPLHELGGCHLVDAAVQQAQGVCAGKGTQLKRGHVREHLVTMHSTVLCCLGHILLYSTAQYCPVMYCTVLYTTVLYCKCHSAVRSLTIHIHVVCPEAARDCGQAHAPYDPTGPPRVHRGARNGAAGPPLGHPSAARRPLQPPLVPWCALGTPYPEASPHPRCFRVSAARCSALSADPELYLCPLCLCLCLCLRLCLCLCVLM